MSWTPAQKNVIETRDCNLLISAAAGSGKTAVLVERIIQLMLKDNINIDRMLVVTFTQAAASEMRERISKALQLELVKNPAKELQLRQQIILLNQASISTIHAFCSDVLRRYFHLANIDPSFRIINKMESDLIKNEILEDVFESAYQDADPEFIDLVEGFSSSNSDQALQELVLRTYEFAQCKPYPLKWLQERTTDFKLNEDKFAKCMWIMNLTSQITFHIEAAETFLQEALRLCYLPDGPAEYIPAIVNDMEIVANLLQTLKKGNVFLLYDNLNNIAHVRLSRTSKEVNQVLKEQAKDLRDNAKDIIGKIKTELLFQEPANMLKDINDLYPLIERLYQLILDFDNKYQKLKQDRGLVDFNDLEHYALSILSNAEVAADYQKKYDYIFIDEYQDSNEVQENIINCIKKERNLFMVGDIKQSIYRFRLADPTLFKQKMEQYGHLDGTINRRIDLNVNFRSRAEILNGVNYIFSRIMSPHLGELKYDDDAALNPGIPCIDTNKVPIEVYLIDKNATDVTDNDLVQANDTEMEALLAAQKIKQLLGQTIYDVKTQSYRPLEYRDIVVLMRSTRNWITPFCEIFSAEGIPVYAEQDTGYFEASEISVIINLLRLIDNRRQDIPLLSVMKSPIGDFTTDELIEIKLNSSSNSFYEAVEAYLNDNENILSTKLQLFMNNLTKWKKESHYLLMDEFIWKLLNETGYIYYAQAMPGGRQRLANLKALLNRAREFQDTSIKGLFNFIKYLDKIQAYSGDMGIARTLGENENLVRIMSIHRSKGLEFPVVIVVGLGKQFNLSDTNSKFLLDKDLGLGPYYVNPKLRIYNDTIARISIKNKVLLDNLSEEMRIFYVACTRPQHQLIMLGSVKNLHKSSQKWCKPLNSYNLVYAKTILDWIGPVLIRHQDGFILRDLAGNYWTEEEQQDDVSHWQINIIKQNEISNSQANVDKMINKLKNKPNQYESNNNNFNLINERLSWKYPFQQAETIPSKVSVSLFQGSQEKNPLEEPSMPTLLNRPLFTQGTKQLTPAQKGSILHLVMQHLDYKQIANQNAIKQQLNTMLEKELLTAEEMLTVSIPKIQKFFSSPLGQRVLKAKIVKREVPFNQLRQAAEILNESVALDEQLLVQGVIDLFFYEDEDIILVDFKSDYINEKNWDSIINYYQPQLKLYKEALESILGNNVKESYLYFFGIDQAILLDI
ncbi:MAG: helicase-exonuclease AddAB subunit AddA [Syntrophomonadaceae bacterium]|jgi:ATP-dependent helicase/nuclease subunit A